MISLLLASVPVSLWDIVKVGLAGLVGAAIYRKFKTPPTPPSATA